MNRIVITSVKAREIINGRGIPAVEAEIVLSDGSSYTASAPSGVSVSSHEAVELRDGGARLDGKGVLAAVRNIRERISPALAGMPVTAQTAVDGRLLELDGTPNKSNLGGNAITAVSLAVTRAGACIAKLPVYRYLGGPGKLNVPMICPNMLSGSPTAGNTLDFEDYLLTPTGFTSVREAVTACVEIFHCLHRMLREKYGLIPQITALAPPVKTSEEAMDGIVAAIRACGYEERVGLGLDVAADQFYDAKTQRYRVSRGLLSREEMIIYYRELIDRYPLKFIEDGLQEDDYEGFGELTRQAAPCLIVGDDLFATTAARLIKGAAFGIRAALFKVNQCGTVTEYLDTAKLAREKGYTIVASVRSGETDDPIQADLAVAAGACFFKVGAPLRGEMVPKYNRLMRIEEDLSS